MSTFLVLSGNVQANVFRADASVPGPTATSSVQQKPQQAASANWRVTVVDAAKYTTNREDMDPRVEAGTFNLLVELKFEYLGPEGNIAAPILKILDQTFADIPAFPIRAREPGSDGRVAPMKD